MPAGLGRCCRDDGGKGGEDKRLLVDTFRIMSLSVKDPAKGVFEISRFVSFTAKFCTASSKNSTKLKIFGIS